MSVDLTLGVELELLAPPGSSRLELARALAGPAGTVVRGFHADAEPSAAPGVGVFHHLTPSFTVFDVDGRRRCSLVDDITLQDDLDREAPSEPGWYRILSDDRRLLRLVARRCDPEAPQAEVLAPIAELFGTEVVHRGGFAIVEDEAGATIALAAGLPGERHRPCEIVTPPIVHDHATVLSSLLAPARALGFTVPAEAAVHLHAHADLVRSPRILRNLVRLVVPHAELFRWMVGTNPRCRRLGPLPDALIDLVEDPAFVESTWEGVRPRLAEIGLSKYVDLNLANAVDPPPGKDTVEWRILPGTLEVEPVLAAAELFQAILRRAADPEAPPRRFDVVPADLAGIEALLEEVGLSAVFGRWLGRQVLAGA